jgi:hypothetical protein
MAAVMMKKLLKIISVGGFAAAILGCPIADLSLKTTIKSLAGPANVGSLKVVNGGTKTFKVTWRDPADKDIDHIEISLQSPFSTDPPPPPVNVAAGVQAANITTPFNSVQYVVIVKTVDKAGNKSAGAIFGSVTLQGNFSLPSTQAALATQGTFSNIGLSTQTSGTAYTYTNQVLTREDYTTTPYPTGNGYTLFSYDGNGRLIKQDDFNSSAVETDYTTYQYDLNGNQTGLQYHYVASSSSNYSYTYQYDANGNMIASSYYDSTGTLQYTDVYAYDSNNRLISISETTSSSSITGTFTWDPTTNFISRFDINFGGSSIYAIWQISPGTMVMSVYSGGVFQDSTTTTYDTHGFLQSSSYYSSGTVQDSSTFTYDSNGNKSTELDYGSSTFSQGFRWTYNNF